MYGTDANSAGLCPYPYLPGVARRFRRDGALSESIASVSNLNIQTSADMQVFIYLEDVDDAADTVTYVTEGKVFPRT